MALVSPWKHHQQHKWWMHTAAPRVMFLFQQYRQGNILPSTVFCGSHQRLTGGLHTTWAGTGRFSEPSLELCPQMMSMLRKQCTFKWDQACHQPVENDLPRKVKNWECGSWSGATQGTGVTGRDNSTMLNRYNIYNIHTGNDSFSVMIQEKGWKWVFLGYIKKTETCYCPTRRTFHHGVVQNSALSSSSRHTAEGDSGTGVMHLPYMSTRSTQFCPMGAYEVKYTLPLSQTTTTGKEGQDGLFQWKWGNIWIEWENSGGLYLTMMMTIYYLMRAHDVNKMNNLILITPQLWH